MAAGADCCRPPPGVPWPVRKIILTQKPTLRLEVTDSSFRFVEQRKDLVDHTYDFGGKCEEVGPDGLQKLVQVEWEGEALVRTDFRRDDGAYHSKTVCACARGKRCDAARRGR